MRKTFVTKKMLKLLCSLWQEKYKHEKLKDYQLLRFQKDFL